MLEVIVMVILLAAVGVPVAKALGFLFNPFWMFTNYWRIKKNDKRVSDFYNSTQSNVRGDFTPSLHISEIPKPDFKYKISREEKPK
jgi:hypothetical protein